MPPLLEMSLSKRVHHSGTESLQEVTLLKLRLAKTPSFKILFTLAAQRGSTVIRLPSEIMYMLDLTQLLTIAHLRAFLTLVWELLLVEE
jgi:hypothetical protein